MDQFQLQLDDEGPPIESYTVRVSRRARSVSLRVLPDLVLEVTIPQRFDRQQIPDIVREHKDWIAHAIDDARTKQEQYGDLHTQWPPVTLNLPAIEQQLAVRFGNLPADASRWRGELRGDQMILLTPGGGHQPREQVAQLISTLLKRKARQFLEPMVALHAREHGLTYRKLSVRGQRTVWGSYSSSGTLCLNYKLLFLPPQLVDYVILHELAHTRYLNHSPAFWRLLESMAPGARTLDREINSAVALVPHWLDRA